MKKSNFLILYLLTSILSQFAQNQTSLTFTAKMQNDTWIALDSVRITNLNRSWTETIYYPDTILQMINSVSISEAEASIFKLYQNTPNPFKGSTSVSLQIRAKENVMLSLYDMNGKCCAIYSKVLEAGEHTFHISVAESQMYFFSVKTSQGYRSIKLLSTEGVDNNVISYECFQPKQSLKTQKAFTSQFFQSGDSMVYEGFATYDGEVRIQSLTCVQNGNNETITFELELPEYVNILFKAQIDTAFYSLDSVVIVNKTQSWMQTVFYPDSIITFTINTNSPAKKRFLLSDTLEYTGYSTVDGLKRYHKIWTNFMEDDTTLVFRLDMYKLPSTHWKRISRFENDSVEISFSSDTFYVDRNGFIAIGFHEIFFSDGAFPYIYNNDILYVYVLGPEKEPIRYFISWQSDDRFLMDYIGNLPLDPTYISVFLFERVKI